MKKLLLAMLLVLGTVSMTGCYAEEGVYTSAPGTYQTGCVEFVDEYGARTVCAPHYYMGGSVVYWDAHFGRWIGANRYWQGGMWHREGFPAYHGYAHPGGAWRGGGSFRGGGGFHGGGHGGGHR